MLKNNPEINEFIKGSIKWIKKTDTKVYNREILEKKKEKLVKDLKTHTYKEVEIIMMLDGSKATLETIRKWS